LNEFPWECNNTKYRFTLCQNKTINLGIDLRKVFYKVGPQKELGYLENGEDFDTVWGGSQLYIVERAISLYGSIKEILEC